MQEKRAESGSSTKDKVATIVDDIGGTIDFFRELGLELEGRAGRVTRLGDQRVEISKPP